jgi:hypothetical protein
VVAEFGDKLSEGNEQRRCLIRRDLIPKKPNDMENKKQYQVKITNTRAVRKLCGLTLLLRVGTSWRCGDGLFFEVSPLASDALLTKLHSLLENVLQTVDHLKISCLGAPFSWLEMPRNRMGEI